MLGYGTELTDEAFYIAEAKLIAQGNAPIASVWSQTPAFALPYCWLIPLHEWLFGGSEGLFLYRSYDAARASDGTAPKAEDASKQAWEFPAVRSVLSDFLYEKKDRSELPCSKKTRESSCNGGR